MDLEALNKALDKVKIQTFVGKNSAFFGSIMCSVNITFDETVDTAETDCTSFIKWNPHHFESLSQKGKETVLIHELQHIARLHNLRCGNRDMEIWNDACDIRINNDMKKDGYEFSFNHLSDPNMDANGILSEEEIYDILIKKSPQQRPKPKGGSGGNTGPSLGKDIVKASEDVASNALNVVIRASQMAAMQGVKAGDLPGNVNEYLDKFLKPKVHWESKLMQFFTELVETDPSWSNRKRRYIPMRIYLPAPYKVEDKLAHLMYFLDVSCSVTNDDLIRFNSEVKYIQEVVRPTKLTLVQFDTKIQKVDVIEEGDPFDGIEINGRGGTCLRCVKAYIEKHEPTAAIIFSDMHVAPMEPLKTPIPIIWVALNNPRCKVPFGELIHLET